MLKVSKSQRTAIKAEKSTWRKDRKRRLLIPKKEAWRGAASIGMMLTNHLAGVMVGNRVLVHNDEVIWCAVRDLPAGSFDTEALKKRPVIWAGKSKASLTAEGDLQVKFFSGNRDFNSCPDYPTKGHTMAHYDTLDATKVDYFRTLNRMNDALSDYAFRAVSNGKPVRRSWFDRNPNESEPMPVNTSVDWLPKPYVALERSTRDRIYDITTSTRAKSSLQCKHCESFWTTNRYRDAKFEADQPQFEATCYHCNKAATYSLDDICSGITRPYYTSVYRAQVCDSILEGMPIKAPERVMRTNVEMVDDNSKIVTYEGVDLEDKKNGRTYKVPLPIDTLIPPMGRVIGTDSPIAYLLNEVQRGKVETSGFEAAPRRKQWTMARQLFKTGAEFQAALKVWLEFQGQIGRSHMDVEVPKFTPIADRYLYPYRLVEAAVTEVGTENLWWDITDTLNYATQDDEPCLSIVPPPIRQRRISQQEFLFSGIRFDLGVYDGRFTGW